MGLVKRDWLQAVAKRDAEGACCRVCGKYPAEMAHVIGRKHDRRLWGETP